MEQPRAELATIEPVQKQHNDMQVINHEGQFVIDSRDVAEMVGKEHKELLKSIRNYVGILAEGNFALSEFFIENTYNDANNQVRTCYLLTKKGCDMVANKMTGAKGVLFTATYVTRFEEMENELKSQQLPQMSSYMIQNPLERAKLWIQEEQERLLLAETVETQVKMIEYKDEVIQQQVSVIEEQAGK